MAHHDPSQLGQVDEGAARLQALVLERMAQPFAWGVQDCCLFAADAVQAQTGVDHAAELRGTYSTAAEALALLDQLGGLPAVAGRAGPEIPPLCARWGDVGMVHHEGRDSLGLCQGVLWLVPAAQGLGPLPLQAATRAWRVRA